MDHYRSTPDCRHVLSYLRTSEVMAMNDRERRSFRRQEFLYAALVLFILVIGLGSLFVIAEAVK